MKTSRLLLIAVLPVVFLLASCLKTAMDADLSNVSSVYFLNATPAAAALDVYAGQKKVSTLYYGQGTGYLNSFGPGSYKFWVASSGQGSSLADTSVALVGRQAYSVILYDSLKSIRMQVIRDDFSDAGTTDSRIRFLQLSPDAGAVDLYMNGVKIYTARSFADNITDTSLNLFEPEDTGTYSFCVKPEGRNDTLSLLDDITLQAGRTYTFFVKGLAGRTDSLGLRLAYLINL